jgi:iron(III) transport system ATP-binding protein
MRAGKLVQVGRAEELYHRPAALFVARLFSEINEIAYKVREGVIETPIGRLPATGIADGNRATLCIRERGVELKREGPGLAGRVLDIKFLGDVALLEVAVEGFEGPLRVRTHESHGLAKGVEVRIEIEVSRVLIFPENSEET